MYISIVSITKNINITILDTLFAWCIKYKYTNSTAIIIALWYTTSFISFRYPRLRIPEYPFLKNATQKCISVNDIVTFLYREVLYICPDPEYISVARKNATLMHITSTIMKSKCFVHLLLVPLYPLYPPPLYFL